MAYTYDVQLEPGQMQYPTRNNRLLQYELYEPDGQSGERLMRTVSYTYYEGGHVSNISIKDEYHAGVTPGQPQDYEWVYDLALYYDTRSGPRLGLWDRWKLDGQGQPDPATYERVHAREFRYEWLFGGMRARYLTADYDPSASPWPEDWPLIEPVHLTDHVGVAPVNDAEAVSGGGPWSLAETRSYLFPSADQDLATGDVQYWHADLIDSTMLTTDELGGAAVSPVISYTAFGEQVVWDEQQQRWVVGPAPGDGPPAAFPRYQYAGGWGYETGGLADQSGLMLLEGANPNLPPITLQHVGWRWYQPDTGRFVQRDPLGLGGGINLYAYVRNDPAARIDPDGTFSWSKFWFGKLLSAIKKVATNMTGQSAPRVLGPCVTVINAVKVAPDITRIYISVKRRQRAIIDTVDPRDFLDNWPGPRRIY